MKNLTIYHNPKCSKSRMTLELLEKAKVPFTVIEYLKTPPSENELKILLDQLGMDAEQITRKTEDQYEALGLNKSPPKTQEAWIKLLVKNPTLIERPIVTNGKNAIIGRPPENIKKILP